MNEPTFYLYQVLWWVFVTFVAFAAALLFWKKGRYEVKGKTLELGFGLKLTGAGGIFVAVLLIFYLINPIKPLKKVFIVYSTERISERSSEESEELFVLEESDISLNDRQFDQKRLSIELIPCQYIYNLAAMLNGNSFTTEEKIPQGIYKIRLKYKDSGETEEYTMRIPNNTKQEVSK